MMLIDVETGATEVLDLEVGVSDPIFRPPDRGTDRVCWRQSRHAPYLSLSTGTAVGWCRWQPAATRLTAGSQVCPSRRMEGGSQASLPSAVEGRGSEIHIIEPDGFGDRVLPILARDPRPVGSALVAGRQPSCSDPVSRPGHVGRDSDRGREGCRGVLDGRRVWLTERVAPRPAGRSSARTTVHARAGSTL